MSRIAFIIGLLLCATGAQAQISNCPSSSWGGGGWVCDAGTQVFQNSNSGITSVTTPVITAVANGDLIIVGGQSCASTTCTVARNQTISISDNAGNSYTCPNSNPQVSFSGNIVGGVVCYVCKSSGGPTQFTATNSDTVNGAFTRIVVTTWHNSNGAIPTSCLDQQSTSTFTTGSGTSAAISTTGNTTANNDLIYSVLMGLPPTGTNNSFTIAQQDGSTDCTSEAKNGATSGSTYPTGWTFSSGPWFGNELAFFAPVASSNNTPAHSAIASFRPYRSYRLPWIYRRDELRIETI